MPIRVGTQLVKPPAGISRVYAGSTLVYQAGGGAPAVPASHTDRLFELEFGDGTVTEIISGGTVEETAGPAFIAEASVGGYVMQGNSGGVRLPATYVLPAAHTMSLWINLDDGGTNNGYLQAGTSGTDIQMQIRNGNEVRFNGHGVSYGDRQWYPGAATYETWVHFAMTYDPVADRIECYKNGVSLGGAAGDEDGTIGQIEIGSFDGFTWVPGKFWRPRAHTRVLTPSEITELYNFDAASIA